MEQRVSASSASLNRVYYSQRGRRKAFRHLLGDRYIELSRVAETLNADPFVFV